MTGHNFARMAQKIDLEEIQHKVAFIYSLFFFYFWKLIFDNFNPHQLSSIANVSTAAVVFFEAHLYTTLRKHSYNNQVS